MREKQLKIYHCSIPFALSLLFSCTELMRRVKRWPGYDHTAGTELLQEYWIGSPWILIQPHCVLSAISGGYFVRETIVSIPSFCCNDEDMIRCMLVPPLFNFEPITYQKYMNQGASTPSNS